MLNKLAFRNAKRSARDYLVYLITMTAVTAMMFAFNSLIFSKDIQKMCSETFMMAVMMGLITFFIVLIVAWLINYMARFMLEKRSREFGTYLLIGLRKKELSRLYMKENLLIGTGAFLLGLLVGFFLQQVIMTVFYQIFELDYIIHVEINSWCMLMTLGCYYGCYLLALLRNKRLFRKMTIADLMRMEKENDKIKEGRERLRQWLFFAAAAYILVMYAFMFRGGVSFVTVALLIVGFIISIYLLYIGFSAFLICRIKKGGKGILRKNRLFILHQMSAKTRTMRFTMGTLTLLMIGALLGGSISMIFSKCQAVVVDYAMPFDVLVYSDDTSEEFKEELSVIQGHNEIEDSIIYRIYENHSVEMNRFFYTHVPTVLYYSDTGGSGAGNSEMDAAGEWREYYEYDTYMCLSDYNHLRKMLGYKEITLTNSQYGLHVKKRLTDFLGQEIYGQKVDAGGQVLELSGLYTEAFSQNGINGADYLIIVPDELCSTMKPYFSAMAADIKGTADAALRDNLEMAYRDKHQMISQDEMPESAENNGDTDSEELVESRLGATGTDQLVVVLADTIVRDVDAPEMKFIVSSVTFPLAYIGMIFIFVALTILAVQQLSDSGKYRFRYDVLRKLGLREKEIDKVILRQLALYYLVPALTAVGVSSVIAVYAGNGFVKYTGIAGSGWSYFGGTLLLFGAVYFLYFLATYVGFKRNIRKQ